MRSSSVVKWFSVAVAATVVAATAAAGPFSSHPQLCVSDQRSDRDFGCVEAADGTRVTLSWIHSVEHQPWTETYVVKRSTLVLEEITVKSYGAGVPADPGGITTFEGGVIHVRHIDRVMPEVRWIHSHVTRHEVQLGDHHINTADIPHHAFVELSIKE